MHYWKRVNSNLTLHAFIAVWVDLCTDCLVDWLALYSFCNPLRCHGPAFYPFRTTQMHLSVYLLSFLFRICQFISLITAEPWILSWLVTRHLRSSSSSTDIWSSVIIFRLGDFFQKKNIVGHHGVLNPSKSAPGGLWKQKIDFFTHLSQGSPWPFA